MSRTNGSKRPERLQLLADVDEAGMTSAPVLIAYRKRLYMLSATRKRRLVLTRVVPEVADSSKKLDVNRSSPG